jgi:hypothetical protein
VLRQYGTKQRIAAFLLKLGRDVLQLLFHFQVRKLSIVLRGVACGLMFDPPIRRVKDEALASSAIKATRKLKA